MIAKNMTVIIKLNKLGSKLMSGSTETRKETNAITTAKLYKLATT